MTTAPNQPREGHLLASHKVGEVQVNIRIGHLDRMPRCKACGRAICDHSDAEFTGVIRS